MNLDQATIIFDLDGTLIDTAPDIIGALNSLLVRHGMLALDLDAARPMIGKGSRELVRRAFDLVGRAHDKNFEDEIIPEFLGLYFDRIDQESRLYDGLTAALDGLKARGAILAVATNKPHYLAIEILERLRLIPYFASVVGADRAPIKKPDAAHLFMAIDEAGGKRDNAVMIGDSQTDHDAARNAALPSILFTHGYSEIALETLAPDALLDHYDALIPTLEAL